MKKQLRKRALGAGRKPIGVERHTITLLREHADKLREISPNPSHAIRSVIQTALPKFCDQCGKEMKARLASFGIVSSCGNLHVYNKNEPFKFCSRCGKSLKMISLTDGLHISGCDCK